MLKEDPGFFIWGLRASSPFPPTTPYVFKNFHSPMNKERVSIDRIKRLAIIALITDDYLMETLVLKGGNAMLMAYDLSPR
jgi:hypothetical protein